MDIMRQSACMSVNPIMVDSYVFIFNCKTVVQTSDFMTALTLSYNLLVGAYCLSLAGRTVAQLDVFFSSDYFLNHEPFSLYHHTLLI